MKHIFPILQRHTCMRTACEQRIPLTPSQFRLIVTDLGVRILFLLVCAVVIGVSLSGWYVFAQPISKYQFPDPATGILLLEQRVQIDEDAMKKMQDHIVLQDATIAAQANALSEMHGMGLAVSGILTCLTLIQMVLGSRIKKQFHE